MSNLQSGWIRGGERLKKKAASRTNDQTGQTLRLKSEAIVHIPVVQIAADRLRVCIREGMFPVGCKISETELCKQMGVSRTTIRKALRLLQDEGLLRHLPGYGMVVPGSDPGGAGE